MPNKTQLQMNNTKLADLITTLQGKAAGGSGSMETCTLTITNTYAQQMNVDSIMATTFEDGNMSVFYIEPFSGQTPITIENVVCNSGVYVLLSVNVPVFTITGDGDTELVGNATGPGKYFRASSIPGSTNTISAYENS